MFGFIGSCLIWILGWLYYVCVICFVGALLGVLSHLAFAIFFVDQPNYAFFASFGFLNGLKYGGVWAGGAAIVLCVIRARKEFLAESSSAAEKLGNE